MPSNRELYFQYLKAGIEDKVILFALSQVNDYDHLSLSQNFDQEIKDYPLFIKAMESYQKGEMIEYFFKKTFFLSSPFYVNKNVLIPRQESEQLVLSSIKYISTKFPKQTLRIADVCTGSGVIGISVASVLKKHSYYLSDISSEAIEVAKINIKNKNMSNIETYVGDMLEPFIVNKIKLDVLLCNPPYIDDIENIDKKTWNNEPHLALLANPNTKFYESIFRNYQKVMNEKFIMCFEIGETMEDSLTKLINECFPSSFYHFEKDMYGKTRFLYIEQ